MFMRLGILAFGPQVSTEAYHLVVSLVDDEKERVMISLDSEVGCSNSSNFPVGASSLSN